MNEDERQRLFKAYWAYTRQQSEQNKKAQEEIDRQMRDDQTRWGNSAAQGAQIGMTAGGPWGALIGGIIGSAKGQKNAYDVRRAEGQSGPEAFFKTMFDFQGGVPDMESVAPGAMQMGQYRKEQQWDKSNGSDVYGKQAQLNAMRAPSMSDDDDQRSKFWDWYMKKPSGSYEL